MVYPPPSHQTESIVDLKTEFLLPAIIIWNPLICHQTQINCDTCGQQMHQSSWMDGSLGYNCPRQIHDLKSNVLLVSAVYTCKSGHKVLAHDAINCISESTNLHKD